MQKTKDSKEFIYKIRAKSTNMILPNVRSAEHSTAVVESTSLVLPYDRLIRSCNIVKSSRSHK